MIEDLNEHQHYNSPGHIRFTRVSSVKNPVVTKTQPCWGSIEASVEGDGGSQITFRISTNILTRSEHNMRTCWGRFDLTSTGQANGRRFRWWLSLAGTMVSHISNSIIVACRPSNSTDTTGKSWSRRITPIELNVQHRELMTHSGESFCREHRNAH